MRVPDTCERNGGAFYQAALSDTPAEYATTLASGLGMGLPTLLLIVCCLLKPGTKMVASLGQVAACLCG